MKPPDPELLVPAGVDYQDARGEPRSDRVPRIGHNPVLGRLKQLLNPEVVLGGADQTRVYWSLGQFIVQRGERSSLLNESGMASFPQATRYASDDNRDCALDD
jgi:hypothetical protein